jgi:GNAT superfamily N-acetyltransferase
MSAQGETTGLRQSLFAHLKQKIPWLAHMKSLSKPHSPKNDTEHMVSVNFLAVPTFTFRVLYAFLVPWRRILHRFGSTSRVERGSRDYAEGCLTSPVGYIEGWWVDPDVRGQGLGALLISAAENWARSRGYTEIASDADLNNAISQLAHRALGYEETQRIVCYRKQL